MTAYVVDASAITSFYRERVANVVATATKSIDGIFSQEGGHIAFDQGGFIQNQWLAVCGGSPKNFALGIWIAGRLVDGKIVPYSCSKDTTLNKTLASFGMELSDRVYVFTAKQSQARFLVTRDIDFHDPSMKTARVSEKSKTKRQKSGRVCLYLLGNHQINVVNFTELLKTMAP